MSSILHVTNPVRPLSEAVYHNRFEPYWLYIVVFMCYRFFLVAPMGRAWVSSSALHVGMSGVRIPVVSSFEEVVGPLLRLAGRQLVCVGRVRGRIS